MAPLPGGPRCPPDSGDRHRQKFEFETVAALQQKAVLYYMTIA
jgi:hypothetical protein